MLARPARRRAALERAAAVLAQVGLAGKETRAGEGPLLRRAARARDRRGARDASRASCSSTSRPPGSAPRARRAWPSSSRELKRALHAGGDRARHALPVPPRRPHLGDPLGPGDRARGRPTSCAPTRGCARPSSGTPPDAELESTGSTPTTARRRCCSTSRSRSAPARWWRCSAPTAPARPRRCARSSA